LKNDDCEEDNMDKIKIVSLVGLGGIGSVYLSAVSEKIPMDDIRVIASGERAARYRKNGVVVNGRGFHFPVYEPGEPVEPADLLLFAVKQTGLEEAIRDARGHRGPNTIILSLLNGITSERIIAETLGAEHLLYIQIQGGGARSCQRDGPSSHQKLIFYVPFLGARYRGERRGL
jgi:2-dehydropantoate 2-reductase